ncbi:MAG: hypothetical protein SNJ59_13710 [Aggregatilineales bacterium]
MEWLTPDFFDTLIIVVIIVGSAFAIVRLYRDFTRPLPPNEAQQQTQPKSDTVRKDEP